MSPVAPTVQPAAERARQWQRPSVAGWELRTIWSGRSPREAETVNAARPPAPSSPGWGVPSASQRTCHTGGSTRAE